MIPNGTGKREPDAFSITAPSPACGAAGLLPHAAESGKKKTPNPKPHCESRTSYTKRDAGREGEATALSALLMGGQRR